MHLLLLLAVHFSVCAKEVTVFVGAPEIAQIKSRPYSNPPDYWHPIREGMLWNLAEMIAFYPSQNYYFLARDMEYNYLLAHALFAQHPKMLDRIKLLNVSRISKGSRFLLNYLEESGFTSEELKKRPAILLDSGYEGNIPRVIRGTLPAGNASRIKVHLLSSGTDEYPESKIFQVFHRNLSVFENGLPHFSPTRVSGYRKIDGKWTAITHPKSTEGENAKTLAMTAQDIAQDIKAYGNEIRVRETFDRLLIAMVSLTDAACGLKDLKPSEIEELLSQLGEKQAEAFVRDLSQAQLHRNVPHNEKSIPAFWKRMPPSLRRWEPYLGNLSECESTLKKAQAP